MIINLACQCDDLQQQNQPSLAHFGIIYVQNAEPN